ncbi:unnamed protein product [Clonostachys solani]|uniref:Uncharacterized protein n=1 Tax=Clonostachys solani TaxID=160281 RepID=A0A9N9Z7G6_9HYPO|nr:unnamed protein product [Clonostachys solani]
MAFDTSVDSTNPGGLVYVLDFLPQALDERRRCGFGRCIRDEIGQRHVRSAARPRDNVALVIPQHGGEELLGRVPQRQHIDLVDVPHKLGTCVQQAAVARNTGVLDEDRRVAQRQPDLVRRALDGLGVPHIAPPPLYLPVRGQIPGEVLLVEDDDRDALGDQTEDDLPSNAAAPARHDGDLLAPVPPLILHRR